MKIDSLEELEKKIGKSRGIIIGAIALFVIGYSSWFLGVNDQPLSNNSEDWGTFGDFLGGLLNPLIAYMAFYWLTKSIVMQRHEMEQARLSFMEQVNLTRKENARLQLQEYMDDEDMRLRQFLFNSHFEPFLFDSEKKIGISSFNQLKMLYKKEKTECRAPLLSLINSQIRTYSSEENDDNRRRWNVFNNLLKDIASSIEHYTEYVILFADVSEIHKVTEKKLDELSGYVAEAYEIGAISLERHNQIVDQINAKIMSAKEKYEKFKAFLNKH